MAIHKITEAPTCACIISSFRCTVRLNPSCTESIFDLPFSSAIFIAMNQVKSIADVVAALDAIVLETIRTESRAGYFAALYRRMTLAVGDGITRGQFSDGARMEKLDVVFAQRYLTAFNAFKSREDCTASWMCTLTGSSNRSLIVLQHLLLGINAHINLDLAIAAAVVAPGDRIHELEGDFNRINVLIASLVDDVQRCLEEVWFPMRFLRNVVNKHGQAVLNFSIGIARQAAWDHAVKLAGMNGAAQAAHIEAIDASVKRIGDKIIHPGPWPNLLLRVIRFTEFEDVARTIRLIDTTVVE
jgi:hypothetical protein